MTTRRDLKETPYTDDERRALVFLQTLIDKNASDVDRRDQIDDPIGDLIQIIKVQVSLIEAQTAMVEAQEYWEQAKRDLDLASARYDFAGNDNADDGPEPMMYPVAAHLCGDPGRDWEGEVEARSDVAAVMMLFDELDLQDGELLHTIHVGKPRPVKA